MKTYRAKTYAPKASDIKRAWHLVDANNRVLGDLAGEIAILLQGKNKATYSANLDSGDYVVVINAANVVLTGKKETDKLYIRHSNYPGGYKEETAAELRARQPEDLIYHAVKGMLASNKLRDVRLDRLKIFAGSEHGYSNYIKD